MVKKKPAVPVGMDDAGTALWEQMCGKYEFRFDELVWLESACRSADRLVIMRDELKALGYMLTGSTGQDVVNPLVAEIRSTEAHMNNALAKLKVPDEGGGAVEVNQNRAAGQSRWAKSYGKGA
ncbi:P27 family phage terminase small subunit [Jonesia denitrificans]|uniref:Terminase small subunit n=1 Tax=Jonesia denitrificans (strain ATCC 14870 / DSM 20603 / BCRC 15368 / CIP 55.134 / JCM 11481 / NBRC 15587 / NCTC 10816 / Prevot 55134) TaxID=471856 RepID=C7R1G6_JONDD|nr:hypothetical protein [Jonesia denitrificans]ACV09801.1 hypothetical protein Jden_2164 [Jonesia denitrificans DSM 20603]ASE08999.1 hypothetical protein CEP80_07515 [Jonesia denitrificans]QXB43544.1 hypothetical protein I6L70_01165 [Jonesia denitrificans]SQH22436.1 Uncharacterised protein [Jonesia denitrificans]